MPDGRAERDIHRHWSSGRRDQIDRRVCQSYEGNACESLLFEREIAELRSSKSGCQQRQNDEAMKGTGVAEQTSADSGTYLYYQKFRLVVIRGKGTIKKEEITV